MVVGVDLERRLALFGPFVKARYGEDAAFALEQILPEWAGLEPFDVGVEGREFCAELLRVVVLAPPRRLDRFHVLGVAIVDHDQRRLRRLDVAVIKILGRIKFVNVIAKVFAFSSL